MLIEETKERYVMQGAMVISLMLKKVHMEKQYKCANIF